MFVAGYIETPETPAFRWPPRVFYSKRAFFGYRCCLLYHKSAGPLPGTSLPVALRLGKQSKINNSIIKNVKYKAPVPCYNEAIEGWKNKRLCIFVMTAPEIYHFSLDLCGKEGDTWKPLRLSEKSNFISTTSISKSPWNLAPIFWPRQAIWRRRPTTSVSPISRAFTRSLTWFRARGFSPSTAILIHCARICCSSTGQARSIPSCPTKATRSDTFIWASPSMSPIYRNMSIRHSRIFSTRATNGTPRPEAACRILSSSCSIT